MEREAVLERTIQDPSISTGAQKGDQLYVSLFEAYACLHLLDNENTLRYLQSHPIQTGDSLKDLLPLDGWLNKGLKPRLVVDSDHVTLIPAALYQEDLASAYANLNFGDLSGQAITVNYLPQADAYVLFAYDASWFESYQQYNGQGNPIHVATPWLASLLLQFQKHDTPVLCFDVTDPQLRVAVIKEGQLQLFNSHRISNNEDLLYYLAATADATGLDLHQHPVYASGMVFKHSERFQQLYRYIRYPRFLSRIQTLDYTHELDKVPEHLFYNILGLPLCES
jgi:hypothetical protein